MSVASQSAKLDFAPQVAKVGPGGTHTVGNYDWKRLQTTRFALGGSVMEGPFPRESGQSIATPDSFRSAHVFGGSFDVIPRLENTFGFLLKGLMGEVYTTANEDVDGNSVTGVYTHRFRFAAAGAQILPWLSWRVFMPSSDGTKDRGEIGFDSLLASMQLTIPAMGKVTASFGVQGRKSYFDNTPSAWEITNSYEYGDSAPDAGRGQFKLAGTTYYARGAQVVVSNGLSSVQDEMVVGEFNPLGFTTLQRSAMVRWMYYYENNEQAQAILTGSPTGTEVQTLPSTYVTSGSDSAVDIRVEGPANIPNTSNPYRLIIQADRATLRKTGPTQVQPGGVLSEPYELEIVEPGEGKRFIEIIIENGMPTLEWGDVANVAPYIIFRSAASYTGDPIQVDSTASLYDPDTSDFNTGTITAALGGTGLDANDALSVVSGGGVTNTAGELSYNGSVVADVVGDGQSGTELVVTFDATASQEAVEAIMRAIQYDRSTGSSPTDEVTVTITVNDGTDDSNSDVVTITHA